MCLSIPSKIVEILPDNYAVVDTMGVKRKVSLDLMPEPVEVGDYVLIHVGYAMTKMSEEDALESLKVYEEIIQKLEEEESQP
ncbi:MAG TPA: HypC/HybG/HupF family hydrogenase formation chaperone [Persephonella sp.]|uniref:Hydrogenase assembly chaperone HypC/HupF n=1 Tax=Persephonella marina (strain DSM 14350 / EX-H1) TaxID=123214 RepID=C0QQ50_PERMH|nr:MULTISPECIES: HypC/HybG/HupF family hydrogenase formation chaperone [Persephonella]ACO03401.1 hydrogenase assembly chaperone HypC/HupF [Persephonella marina EX-H1]HCB69589.1 HypC/HybG/HupF family hydrogenase formation chaperone [Persephonella sp.]